MTYYAILMDPDYMGVYRIKESRTLKGCCAALRKMIKDEGAEYGLITTKKPSMGQTYSRYPPETVGVMNVRISRRKVKVGNTMIPKDDYVFYKKVPNRPITYWPGYIVLYDGTMKALF